MVTHKKMLQAAAHCPPGTRIGLVTTRSPPEAVPISTSTGTRAGPPEAPPLGARRARPPAQLAAERDELRAEHGPRALELREEERKGAERARNRAQDRGDELRWRLPGHDRRGHCQAVCRDCQRKRLVV